MVIVGIDAHKRSHTAVAVDETGRKLGQHTTGTTSEDHLALLSWAEQFGDLTAVGDRGLPAPVPPARTGSSRRR